MNIGFCGAYGVGETMHVTLSQYLAMKLSGLDVYPVSDISGIEPRTVYFCSNPMEYANSILEDIARLGTSLYSTYLRESVNCLENVDFKYSGSMCRMEVYV